MSVPVFVCVCVCVYWKACDTLIYSQIWYVLSTEMELSV